jgi:hypothetical protein
MQSIKAKRKTDEAEIWLKNPRDKTKGLLVYLSKKHGVEMLYNLEFELPLGGKNPLIATAKLPGVEGGWLRPLNVWPANASFIQRQWSDSASKMMRYVPDYEQKVRQVYNHNWQPKYPYYLAGDIKDPEYKPYVVDQPIAYANISPAYILGKGARPLADHRTTNIIATRLPTFDDGKLKDHWVDHRGEFLAFMSSDTPHGYETLAQDLLLGKTDARTGKPLATDFYVREFPTTSNGAPGDCVVWSKSIANGAVTTWASHNNIIRTLHTVNRSSWEYDKSTRK